MSGIQLSSATWFSSQLEDLFANLPSLISSITLRVTRDNKGCSRPGGRWATWKCAMRTCWIFVFDLKVSAGKEWPVPEALWCFGWKFHDNFQGFCWNKSAFSSPVKFAIYSVFLLSSSSSLASQALIASSHLYWNCLQQFSNSQLFSAS